MALFKDGDLGFVSTIVSDEVFTPSKPCGRRPDDVPKEVEVDGQTYKLEDVPVPEYGAEWWWTYFWKEAKEYVQRATDPQKNTFVTFFNMASVKPDTLRPDDPDKRYVIPKGPLLKVCDDTTLRAAMDAALAVGFEWIDMGPAGIQVSAEALRKYILNVDKRVEYKMVWRGGEREWENVRQYGYAAAARYEADAGNWNMRESWHPFHDPVARAKVYYRKGQMDNCLFTAVSVTDDWKAALCYPKIEQSTELMQLAQQARGVASLEGLKDSYPRRVARVTYTDGKVEYKLANVTRIALMILEGMVLDTRQRQADSGVAYPELGAETIVGSNVVAMLEYTRVFHGLTDEAGFTAFLNPPGSHLIDRQELVVMFRYKKAGSEYYGEILTEVSKARVHRISLCWSSSGTATAARTVAYWSEVVFADGTVIKR